MSYQPNKKGYDCSVAGVSAGAGGRLPLRVAYAGWSLYRQGNSFAVEKSPHCIISLNLYGSFFIKQSGQEYRVSRPGEVLILQPGMSHYYRCDSAYKAHRYLALAGELLQTLLQACGLESAVVIQPRSPDQVNKRLRTIQRLLSEPTSGSDLDASERAFGLLLQLSDTNVAVPPAAVQRAIRFLHLNLDRKVSAQELSLNAGLSRSQLHAQFVRTFALSPLRYQRRMRMESAKNLLLHPAKSIKEVAAQLGYSDQLCFSRDFKNYAGISPRGFRQGLFARPHDPEGK